MDEMYTLSAEIYDAIYAWKDYAAESALARQFIERYALIPVRTLLDVACGTGKHLEHLKTHYAVEGLDLNEPMLAVARQRHPGVPFHQGDMHTFDLGRTFDAVTCLFSAIGSALTEQDLNQIAAALARHVAPGGVLLVEPWLHPDRYRPGSLHAHFVDEPELKVARMTHSQLEDGCSVMDFHYLVGTPQGIRHFVERLTAGLFTEAQYIGALQAAGLRVTYDSDGLRTHRGLLIGVKPL